MNKIRVLVACEESQAVTKAFREIGHEAFSCDLQECSGGHPEWHFCEDVFEVIKREPKFDLMIAHPPCTYLAVSGARWLYNKDGTRNEARWINQYEGINFVKKLMDVDIDRIAIENPVSVISSQIREPDQIIQPYWFGDKSRKTTCLWLKNLPKLIPTEMVEPDIYICKNGKTFSKDYMVALKAGNGRGKARSKTYLGIAKAMADQWGDVGNLGIQLKMF
jgi:site-specific DNA-cytosine methylase